MPEKGENCNVVSIGSVKPGLFLFGGGEEDGTQNIFSSQSLRFAFSGTGLVSQSGFGIDNTIAIETDISSPIPIPTPMVSG
jgi:hypothetical protein